MTPQPLPIDQPWVTDTLGDLTRRFTHHDQLQELMDAPSSQSLAVVTGFGPTNAPTAGTLSVMLGIIELQRHLRVPVTAVVSELGAWNSRNVRWQQLVEVRDQMIAFLAAMGFDTEHGLVRSHLDMPNLVRAGRVARFLTRQDFLDHHEDLAELYEDHGLLGSEVGVTVDALYTVADILGPAEAGADRVLMVSGLEENYFTALARIVMDRQVHAGQLSMGWDTRLGALYFRVLEGLGGYPKMSKSIPASSIHLGMPADQIRAQILTDDKSSQVALMSAIELSSGWDVARIQAARRAFAERDGHNAAWTATKQDYTQTFLTFAQTWRECAV